MTEVDFNRQAAGIRLNRDDHVGPELRDEVAAAMLTENSMFKWKSIGSRDRLGYGVDCAHQSAGSSSEAMETRREGSAPQDRVVRHDQLFDSEIVFWRVACSGGAVYSRGALSAVS